MVSCLPAFVEQDERAVRPEPRLRGRMHKDLGLGDEVDDVGVDGGVAR
jgi:hypothetical protein